MDYGSASRGRTQWGDMAPFVSYAPSRSDSPRFHIRRVQDTARAYPAHKHDYFQILYFMSEAPVLRVGLTSERPGPGSIYFVAPMVPHQVQFDAATRCVVIYFDLDFLRPGAVRSFPTSQYVQIAPELMPFVWQDQARFDLDAAQTARVERSIATLLRQHRSERVCSIEVVRAELLLLLAMLCQDYEEEFSHLAARLPLAGRAIGHMRRISDFVAENYVRGPGLDEAAREIGLSRSRLCALIRQHTGSTFVSLIREMRLDDARERLSATDLPIAEIAYRVGYNDEKYFLRAFRKSMGMTPSAYRRKRALERAAGRAASSGGGGGLSAGSPGLMPTPIARPAASRPKSMSGSGT